MRSELLAGFSLIFGLQFTIAMMAYTHMQNTSSTSSADRRLGAIRAVWNAVWGREVSHYPQELVEAQPKRIEALR